jgi:superfamily II DNA/RNA helicase
MAASIKSKKQILEKLNIAALNEMQETAAQLIPENDDVIILSPTGSGKTLAFLLPILDLLDPEIAEVQAIIVTPTRELAIQIEQVIREMGSGYKANAIYGGRPGAKDKEDLQHKPAILIATPGRLADHLSRESFPIKEVKTLVLDEFDKSLEIGFADEMKEIIWQLTAVNKKILTSATTTKDIPAYLSLRDPVYIDFSSEKVKDLSIQYLKADSKDKLVLLGQLLAKVGSAPLIIFCNFKESISRISEYLNKIGVAHGAFYGGLEQFERERALIKFRNGSYNILLATDLAARGIDVPEIQTIIHYHLPIKAEEFIHRNGRTARMHQSGTAYVLLGSEENLPPFISAGKRAIEEIDIIDGDSSQWTTIFVSGGRKDKISKGDIAGFFMKEGKLTKEQLGLIELKQDCAFVSVVSQVAEQVVEQLNNGRIKKRKVRVNILA